MSDWCIENDFAAQKEQADTLEYIVCNLRQEYKKLRDEFNEYKEAMECYMGRGRCLEALEQYRLENK